MLFCAWHCGKPKSTDTAKEEVKEAPPATSPGPTNELTVANKSREELQDTTVAVTPPKKEEKPKNIVPQVECAPEFVRLSEPGKSPHLYMVKKFKPEQYACWEGLEKHAIEICGETMPCFVNYVESSTVKPNSTPPYYVEAAALKKYGIGRFEYKDFWWELRGAKIWNRTGKGFDYYNSSRY